MQVCLCIHSKRHSDISIRKGIQQILYECAKQLKHSVKTELNVEGEMVTISTVHHMRMICT